MINSLFFVLPVYADQTFMSGTDYSSVVAFNDSVYDVFVESGAEVSSVGNTITMNGPICLHNSGIIYANIDTNEQNLSIYNSGTIYGDIINTNGNVTQIITFVPEITNINVIGGVFNVQIENLDNLDFSIIEGIDATAFDVKNTSIVIDDFAQWQNWGKTVNLSGPISLIITDTTATDYDGEIIGNIFGNNSVIVNIDGLDSSTRTETEIIGNRFKLKIIRETNYSVINNGANSALEKIRQSDPNDKLIKALDSATSTNEINNIISKSYRFNHGILLRPIRVTNNFTLMNGINDKSDFGLGFTPMYTISDKISNLGGRIYIGNNYNDFYLNFGLQLNRFEYSDDINDFSGFTYGADIKLKQYFEKLWFKGVGGINVTKFKANYISDNEIKDNPYGISWYTLLDGGYDFYIGNDFIISPFVGAGYQNYKVADVLDNDFYVRGGAGLKYSFITDGIKYEYGLDGAIASNGNLYSSAKVGFWSVTDEAGATLSVGILKDDFDYNYQLSLNAKMLF